MFKIDPRLSVAPMMNWTDRHCRFFHRLLSKNILLYTEMLTSGAIIHGSRDKLLKFSELEHPVALQLGGSVPNELSEAARIGVDFGYDEINLNLGCPSSRVQAGYFGAALMKNPDLVFECVSKMKRVLKNTKLTVKCRLGVDDQNPELMLPKFVKYLIDSGVDGIIIHARKAILNGLTPKENRNIPMLDYGLVKRMKKTFSETEISINGGVSNLKLANNFLNEGLDGVMIGRAAYHNPNDILLNADKEIFREKFVRTTMKKALLELCNYVEFEMEQGVRLNEITRHILGAFNGIPGARQFRRTLAEQAHKKGAGPEVIKEAIEKVCDE